ncbi:MAG TPA: CHAD domain-containing protein [Ktedonobacteraceae bacterium]|nr:CHAD domain-containing protein [Ktedonobacteraceae bacterium]
MAKAKAITGLDPQAPVATNARLIAQTRLEELYQWDRSVDNPYSIRELHDMRIAAKRLRYTLEVFEEVLPATSKSIVNELTKLQDELGDLHDSDVMIALVRLCLTNQSPAAKHASGNKKALVPSEMTVYLLDPSAVPTAEQRYGLETFLHGQEHLRTEHYDAFRRHWYELQARDFRREILDILSA